jgi:hypothetical protein
MTAAARSGSLQSAAEISGIVDQGDAFDARTVFTDARSGV